MSKQRPLEEITVLATRARADSEKLCAQLEALGAQTLIQPGIEILPAEDPEALHDACHAVVNGQFNWLVFSSVNGVRYALAKLKELCASNAQDVDETFTTLGVRCAAVGAKTSQALREEKIECALEPRDFNAQALAESFLALGESLSSARILSFRANRGSQTLAYALRERVARFEEVTAYRSVDATHYAPGIETALRHGRVDFTLVMSSATGYALCKLFGDNLDKTRFLALSEQIAHALRQCGATVAGVAQEATTESLIALTVEQGKRLKRTR